MRDWGKDTLLDMQRSGRYTVTLDDDLVVPRLIQKILGLETRAFATATEMMRNFETLDPAAIFVDVHLAEGECGLDVIPQAKARWPESPIIVLSGDASDSIVGRALADGADDFIRKPIRPAELTARLITRKNESDFRRSQTLLHFCDLRLDMRSRCLEGDRGKRFQSPKEAEILACLIQEQGAIVDRTSLRLRVWGNVAVNDNAIDRKLFEVRAAIRDVSDSVEIHSVYGAGVSIRERRGRQKQVPRATRRKGRGA